MLKNSSNTEHGEVLQIESLEVVSDESFRYLNPQYVYFSYFKLIPSIIYVNGINIKKFVRWIKKEKTDWVLNFHSYSELLPKKKNKEIIQAVLVLKEDLMIGINGVHLTIYFPNSNEELAYKLIKFIKAKFPLKVPGIDLFYMISQNQMGLNLHALSLKKTNINLKENYNDDLLEAHPWILKNLNMSDKSGLYLFYGLPGTGKSTYVRYLISQTSKKVLFLPSNLVGILGDPVFNNILVENKDCILVIEDAEEVLQSRDTGINSGISFLLNLTDGLLGEGLGIQVICTLNAHLSKIDHAALRKGRLLARYHFDALNFEKANALLKKNNIEDFVTTQDMTLADIYHFTAQPEINNNLPRKSVGFNFNHKTVETN